MNLTKVILGCLKKTFTNYHPVQRKLFGVGGRGEGGEWAGAWPGAGAGAVVILFLSNQFLIQYYPCYRGRANFPKLLSEPFT